MLAVLPALFFILTLLGCVARGSSWRRSFLSAAIVSGLLLAAMTELLSLFQAVDYASLAVCWGFSVCAAAVHLLLRRHGLYEWRQRRVHASALDCLPLGAALAVVLLPTLLIAVVCPPNNLDSMTYHMSKVMHWIQNGSVAHYPTSGARQLYLSPWAEFAIMHLQILSGGDYLANLVQWFAMCGSIIGVTLITQELGASGRVQACSAIIVATLPMGILQATSTQNDYVVSFWLVCFVYFGLLLLRERQPAHVIAVGAALGLAILTKGTAYIFALPFVLWFACAALKSRGLLSAARFVLTLAVLVVALNTGHWVRNYRLWGNPLSTDKAKVGNEYFSPAVFLSNLSRNVVYQTWTPVEELNRLQYRSLERLHDLLGIDISDPRTTMFEKPFRMIKTSTHEDFAGNGLHLLLFLLALPVLALRRRKLPPDAVLLCLALVGGYALFSGLIKWSVWGNRLQLPFFVLASPLLAVVFPFGQRRWLVPTVTVCLLLCSTPWIFQNHTRQLIGDWSVLTLERERLYFTSRQKVEPYYLALANSLAGNSGCDTVAIISSEDGYEYPLWAMLNNRLGRMPRIEHIKVDNPSGSIPLRDFRPCATVNLM